MQLFIYRAVRLKTRFPRRVYLWPQARKVAYLLRNKKFIGETSKTRVAYAPAPGGQRCTQSHELDSIFMLRRIQLVFRLVKKG